MDAYVFATRHNIKMFDLTKTLEGIYKVAGFIASVLSANGTVLVVGTKPQSRDLNVAFAKRINQPVVADRWLGGTLTNFKTIRKRIDYFEDLLRKRESGELEKYTKKERLDFDKEIKDLGKKFDGVRALKAMPQALFVIDIKKHDIAVHEARLMGIPVAGVVDTDSNPDTVNYMIPSNDDSRAALQAILDLLARAVEKVKPKAEGTESTAGTVQAVGTGSAVGTAGVNNL